MSQKPFDKQRFADRARYLIKYQGYGKGQYNNFNNQMWDESKILQKISKNEEYNNFNNQMWDERKHI